MIHDIKVFDRHGNLKEILNGQEIFEKVYDTDAKMIHKTQNFGYKNRKKQRKLTCPYCKEEFHTARDSQFICGSKECSKRRSQASNLRRYKAERTLQCRVCNIKVKTRHPRQVTCASVDCRKENNRVMNLVNSHKRKADKDVRTQPGDIQVAGRKRKVVQGEVTSGKTDKTLEAETGRLYKKYRTIQPHQ